MRHWNTGTLENWEGGSGTQPPHDLGGYEAAVALRGWFAGAAVVGAACLPFAEEYIRIESVRKGIPYVVA